MLLNAFLVIFAVAPCLGAWIEIKSIIPSRMSEVSSHPAWVRGLKFCSTAEYPNCGYRRTLRGCMIYVKQYYKIRPSPILGNGPIFFAININD